MKEIPKTNKTKQNKQKTKQTKNKTKTNKVYNGLLRQAIECNI